MGGLQVAPYHAYVPAFGEWGFALATRQPWQAPDHYPPGLRFLTVETTAALFQFPPDMAPVETEDQPAEQPNFGALLRAGMESGDAVSFSSYQFQTVFRLLPCRQATGRARIGAVRSTPCP